MTAERLDGMRNVMHRWPKPMQDQFIALFAELDAERAAHDSSEQTIRELRDRLEVLTEPGTPIAVVSAMFDFAIAECGHPKYSARHAMTTIRQTIQRERELSDQLAAALKSFRDSDKGTYQQSVQQCEAALAQHAAMR